MKTLTIFLKCILLSFSVEHYFRDLNATVGNIEKVHKFNVISRELSQLPEKTIVFLDIDDVIITPRDSILKSCNGTNPFKLIKFFHQKIGSSNSSDERNFYLERLGTLYLTRKVELSEPEVGEFVNSLIQKGYTVTGITGINIGACGRIPNIEEWRIKELEELGVSFSSQLVTCNEKGKNSCIYKSGIIFIGDQTKSYCISKILDMHPHFENVILVDDQKNNLEQVAKLLSKSELNFRGFHYVGAKDTSCKLDFQVANFQWMNLMENNIWLYEKEVEEQL